jgi:hypothetical protein
MALKTLTLSLSPETCEALQDMSKQHNKSLDAIVEEAVQQFREESSLPQNGMAKGKGPKQRPQGFYRPQTQLRQAAVVPKEAALLFIDIQNYNCHREGSESKALGSVSYKAPLHSSVGQ